MGLGTSDTIGDSSVASTLSAGGRVVGHAIFASSTTTSQAARAIGAIVVIATANRDAWSIDICNC